MLDLDDMRRRYRELSSVEDSKEKIIEDLFSQVEELRKDLTKAHDEVDNYKELAGLFKDKSNKDKEALEMKNRDHARLSFVSVLVDGDGMNFQDHLIQSGYDGGQKAVQLLRKAVEDYLFQLDPEANPRIQCKIRVYANVSGLSKTYRDTSIAPVDGTLEAFIQGFNMENGLCDFVDAGNGKECSDVKLRALFEQDILDVHCQRVIFCASADNGYARVLGPHRESDRISLVEGPSFAREIKELAPHFATTSFPDVFRSTKITSRRVSFSNVTPPRTPPRNYASAVKTTPPRSQSTSDVNRRSPSPLTSARISNRNRSPVRLAVCKNAAGQRVDPPLRYSTKENVDELKQRKLCNPYHIVGLCPYGENCNHDHESRLRPQQVEDLRYIARLRVCPRGIWCAEESCVCGHRCPRENCPGPGYNGCKFPKVMHGVDSSIVATTL
ncbi:CCCH zinc finger DNA binding protein [Aspergillus bombycis]|uniref:CCCH zinc finger DNA binding protein n=1 Tax=Aspergillus bombycis TaxID=109264 RepID=A0A1F7ZKW2_9EURO|nr:CCCH zinc finger DNA binding protein [Aspergillus bombycis]OGM39778.1 CCCH zinc finger DNA binding protein [Aspergillus bombycis]